MLQKSPSLRKTIRPRPRTAPWRQLELFPGQFCTDFWGGSPPLPLKRRLRLLLGVGILFGVLLANMAVQIGTLVTSDHPWSYEVLRLCGAGYALTVVVVVFGGLLRGSCVPSAVAPGSRPSPDASMLSKVREPRPKAAATATLTTGRRLQNENPEFQPTIILAHGLLEEIGDYLEEFLSRYGDDNEAGGVLVGKTEYGSDGTITTLLVTGFIPAGPNANFDSGSILFDSEYQDAALRILQLQDPSIRALGCIHRHPGDFDQCSGGDLRADSATLSESGAELLISAIVTLDNDREDPLSIRFGRMKVDFFVLTRSRPHTYQRPRVETKSMALTVLPEEALIEYARRRGGSLTADLTTLRALPLVGGLRLLRAQMDHREGVCVALRDTQIGGTVIFLNGFGSGTECVVTEDGNGSRRLRGAWNLEEVGIHVWLSEILITARLLIEEERSVGTVSLRRYAPWWEREPHRLELERQAMEELFETRVRLARRGDALCWEATLRESGRSLDVFIVYPGEYPVRPPTIESAKPLPVTPHSPGNTRQFCWVPYTNSEWNPARDTAAVALLAAGRWYAALLVFQTLGHWPEQADHPRALPER